jgi:hypothetical protein
MTDIEKQADVKESPGHETPEGSSEHGVGDTIPYIDPVLEKQALRKFDKWLLPQMMLLVAISFLDRSNIG